MSNNAQHKPAGLGDFLYTLFAAWMVGGLLAVWLALTARGSEILQMPAWTWGFALVAGSGAVVFHAFARTLGDPVDTALVLKAGGVALFGGLSVLFLTGFFSDAPEPQVGAPTLGQVPIAEMTSSISHAVGWGALVFVPALAFIANAALVLALRKRLVANRR